MSTTSFPGPGAGPRPWTISRHCAPLATSARTIGHAHDPTPGSREPAPGSLGARRQGAGADRDLSARHLGPLHAGVLPGAVRGGAAAPAARKLALLPGGRCLSRLFGFALHL